MTVPKCLLWSRLRAAILAVCLMIGATALARAQDTPRGVAQVNVTLPPSAVSSPLFDTISESLSTFKQTNGLPPSESAGALLSAINRAKGLSSNEQAGLSFGFSLLGISNLTRIQKTVVDLGGTGLGALETADGAAQNNPLQMLRGVVDGATSSMALL